jgi:ComF family protein
MNFINRIFAKIVDIFYPKTCISCEKHGKFLCEDCKGKIKFNNEMFLRSDHKLLRNSHIQKLFVPCPFNGNPILRKAVHLMKYKFYQDLAEDLGEIVARALKESASSEELRNAVLIPIPLHKSRLRLRGFNQAELLARSISVHTGIPIAINLITRTRATKSQATLSRTGRLTNMQNAFKVLPGAKTPPITNSTTIILIDDICTTLATMENTAKAFQKTGFRVVLGAVIAHD